MMKKLSVNESGDKVKNKSKHLFGKKTDGKLKNESKKICANKAKIETENESEKCLNSKQSHRRKIQKIQKREELVKEIKHPISSPLSDVLKGIESVQISDEQFKHYVHSLTNFLTNPLHSPDITNLIYHIISFLYLIKGNYLIYKSQNHSGFCCLTSVETCVVEALFSIQNDSNLHMQCLITTVLHLLHQLVLIKQKLNIYGLACMCRVLTEICKRNSDKEKVLSLCCSIVKVKHQYGPYLIASIVEVWKELFMMSDSLSEESILLLGCLSFVFKKKPERLSKSNWNCSFELLTGLLPSVPDVNKAIEICKERILVKCLENTFEEFWRISSPFLILLAQKPWDWVKVQVVDMYIIPNLQRFSRLVSKEEGFSTYCNLCIEVCMLNPEFEDDKVLNLFYDNLSLTGHNFVRDCIAVSLMKYFIILKKTVPSFLAEWFKNNQDNPKVQVFGSIFQERLMSDDQDSLSIKDIAV